MGEMAAKLPYFRFYPKDFDTDERVRGFDPRQIGIFVLALNHAWINDGLPSDESQLARLLRVTPRDFRAAWPAVRGCFQEFPDGRLKNNRQESERLECVSKSAKASESAKKRWSVDANALSAKCEGNARAYDYDSDASFLKKRGVGKNNELAPNSIFPDWWEIWSKVRGTHHSVEALQAWQRFVPVELESAVIECTASYLASLDNPAKGYNPDRFLESQAKEQFQSRWPACISGPKRESATEKSIRIGYERVQKTGRL